MDVGLHLDDHVVWYGVVCVHVCVRVCACVCVHVCVCTFVCMLFILPTLTSRLVTISLRLIIDSLWMNGSSSSLECVAFAQVRTYVKTLPVVKLDHSRHAQIILLICKKIKTYTHIHLLTTMHTHTHRYVLLIYTP